MLCFDSFTQEDFDDFINLSAAHNLLSHLAVPLHPTMPHPATPGPGEGESSAVSPVYPSANAVASSSRLTQGDKPANFSPEELKRQADAPRADVAAGAEVDLRVQRMKEEEDSRKKLRPPKGWLHFVAGG